MVSRAEREDTKQLKRDKYVQLCRDYSEVFSSAQGMRVLDDILGKGYLWTTTCFGDGKDAFREGKRDHALYIMKRVNTGDSNVMIRLMKDNQKLLLERENK